MNDAPPVLLFDGVCALCQASVRFVLAHESERRLTFAPLQSNFARRRLAELGIAFSPEPETVYLLDGDRLLTHSDAALAVVRHLNWPWRALMVFHCVPRPIRDAVYRVVARHRYRWFGRTDLCARMPKGEANRFLA
jgi:predicted DCC family thiol-disulfide oxidoreductase YuxK